MTQLITVNGVRGYIDETGIAQLHIEDISKGLGFIQQKGGATYIRWETVNRYLNDYGFSQLVGKEYLPENVFYLLAMKANNETAVSFQMKVANEILPSIRKTGSYSIQHQLPQDYKQALIALVAQVEETEQAKAETLLIQAKVEEQRPLVFFAESIQISKDSILVNDMSTLLKQNGVDIGEKRLFAWLRENGYLIKSGSEYNMPTQRSMDLKIMEVKMGSRNSSDGTVKITRTPKITGKGQIYFINKFADKIA